MNQKEIEKVLISHNFQDSRVLPRLGTGLLSTSIITGGQHYRRWNETGVEVVVLGSSPEDLKLYQFPRENIKDGICLPAYQPMVQGPEVLKYIN